MGRVAAQVVTGMGFLGAGTILHARGTVLGLMSAATPQAGAVQEIEGLLRDLGLKIEDCHIRHDQGEIVLEVDVLGPRRLVGQARTNLLDSKSVRSVSSLGPGAN